MCDAYSWWALLSVSLSLHWLVNTSRDKLGFVNWFRTLIRTLSNRTRSRNYEVIFWILRHRLGSDSYRFPKAHFPINWRYNYRPQRSCECYVFTGVCLSTGGCLVRGSAPGGGGSVQHLFSVLTSSKFAWKTTCSGTDCWHPKTLVYLYVQCFNQNRMIFIKTAVCYV